MIDEMILICICKNFSCFSSSIKLVDENTHNFMRCVAVDEFTHKLEENESQMGFKNGT